MHLVGAYERLEIQVLATEGANDVKRQQRVFEEVEEVSRVGQSRRSVEEVSLASAYTTQVE